MSKVQRVLFILTCLLAGYSATLRAEDTDIYVDNATNNGVPNVLFIIDNGANFSANAKIGCSAYTGTTDAPTLGTSTGAGVLQCALVDAIKSLPNDSMNIGILVSNASNFANDTRNATDTAYHEKCETDTGGCLIRKLTLMSSDNKTNLINFIKSWKDSGQTNASSFNIKVNTALPGNMMQEAWAYFNGKTGMSGKTYSPSLLATGCQRNFVIYIANTEKTPANEDDSYSGTYGLTSTQVGATAAQKIEIKEKVTFNPATCGVTSINYGSSKSDWSSNWADEWARLMYQQDGGTSTQENPQNIITYTVGITNDQTCTAEYPALLTTMAKYGGGKHFKVSTVTDMTTALQAQLNEVQAVNSVFSSASLPVSVNAEGSYLNQIYLGMFRPDSSGAPRWMGNLKQYQLIKDSSGKTVLGDSSNPPKSALSSSGTGFISPNAVSFWTYKNTSTVPDDSTTGGFWVNDKKGVPESGYDSPDGEVVEKGGVAQQLRKESLTSTFSGAMGTGNSRRLFTYCPSGTTCESALTSAANELSTNNALIPATAFGGSTSIGVTSIVRSGTSAVVTTSGNHGFSDGTSVTISNAGQNEYNVTQAVSNASGNTFTITGLPDYPTSPSAGAYTVSSAASGSVGISSISRSISTTGGANSEVVTVQTAAPHGFTTSSNITISGATPSNYNYSGTPSSVPTATSFTFPVAIEPRTPAQNGYTAVLSPTAYPAFTATLTNPSVGAISGSTSTAHNLHVGQTVTISGASENKYHGTFTIATVPTVTSFTITGAGNDVKNLSSSSSTVTPATTTTKAITVLSRTGTTASATAVATGLPSGWFGAAAGQVKTVTIAKASGSQTNESGYVLSNVTATCLDSGCTSFSYPVTVTPTTAATGTMSVGLTGAASVNLAAGAITRSGTTATASGLPSGTFTSGQQVTIAASGTALTSESAYVGTWQISCSASTCTSFSFGPVTLSPASPATGTNISAYSGSTPPDRDTVIKWMRGQDNYGDEKGPGGTVTVRPSIHGDVLHSRPLVINYGDADRGIVVFYGANDGVFRAVNGNQTASIGSFPAGSELWGLVLPEHFGKINRLRLNSPELKFPSTTLSSAQPKDYFVDGATGAYQKIDASGKIDKAYIYLTMRRGGRYIYGLDVSTPTSPSVLWTKSDGSTGFEELGQTWSRPRTTLVQGGGLASGNTPVLVFGGGYDPQQDSEPPGIDSMGRGIFVVNATTGALIWSATPTCTTSATCRKVPEMLYAIPTDIATVDRDENGYTDKLYFGDLGGNIWRADISDASTANWTVTKIAALGCDTGACTSGTPRKFFFPPSVLPVKKAGAVGSYDIIALASGDREHPLKRTVTGSSYYVQDHFFAIRDANTAVGTPTAHTLITKANLDQVNGDSYDSSFTAGFYVDFAGEGEKGVNAPLAVNGKIFFATNRPMDKLNTCAANLGEAKAYSVNPFTGATASKVLAGGGLPPSAVSGIVTIVTTNADGSTTSTNEKFCIGCSVGTEGGTSDVALENTPPPAAIPKNLRRTYWYKK